MTARSHTPQPNRQRMASEHAGQLMRRRSAIVEHPFGTLKCRAGYQHFRGFDKVRGEWSLTALSYNFSRAVNILGFDDFVRRIAESALAALHATFSEPMGACKPISLALIRFWPIMQSWLEIAPRRALSTS